MKKYELVFNDDFNGKELDERFWNVISREENFNQEDQSYTQNNHYLKDSKLFLIAKKEMNGSRLYTSCRLDTFGKVSLMYGRVEVKAKIPLGRGTWPAIWLLGNNVKKVGWPQCGEIDMMEHVGYNLGYINYWLHAGSRNHTVNKQRGGRSLIKNIDQFHVYALEWGPNYLEIYIDDVRVFVTHKQKDDTVNEWPFDQPFHLILNIAIGGQWGGSQGIDDTIFPAVMEVDYVKMYKIEDNQEEIDLDSKRQYL